MMRTIKSLPRVVFRSACTIVAALVAFAVLWPVLSGARDDAFDANRRLTSEITQTNRTISQAKADQEYVNENKAQYEALLQSDRLVPHTRRAAIAELENAGRAYGLTALNYSIGAVASNSPTAVASQPGSAAYRVSVENIALKVGAPIDGAIYRFIDDIAESFLGAAVIQSVTIRRAGEIDSAALAAVSAGRGAQFVEGEIEIHWRTAQPQEQTPP